ncbi:HSP90-domain-containing protein [Armillaria solidipes]|uniref:HSP90-domain-containing protein n=1 Tax=Armillaria solidipes TaxID=1076256 RepID=A0A2H3BNZ1_9AGAR|nr:HSP90-domain-containing protein [Armillaria solidipes]
MSAPPFASLGPPPLPMGWTQHAGPNGQPYYFNAHTKESTYVRPLPSIPNATAAVTTKKEKPAVKIPIPGTEWMRVKTTGGNTFYFHKSKKTSLWTVPEEIKDALEKFEQEEAKAIEEGKLKAIREEEEAAKRAEEERDREVERIKAEVQNMVKRKAQGDVPVDEVVVSKKPKLEEKAEEDSDESEEEDWQREAAEQLAAEAEVERKRQEEEALKEKELAEQEAKALQEKQIKIPDRVDLSIEEGKALFKTLLREKDVNPLHPWDTSLPLFVSDPRYVLLPSVSTRRDAFDAYCRERARELRQQNVKKEKEAGNPKDEFDRLLATEVKSTRLSWGDFRRSWKKDRRFYGWGRDDREREKRFKEHLKELGEKKRAASQKAEFDFFALLRENQLSQDAVWKDVKRSLTRDPRYDAVGSSSLREELFKTFQKAQEKGRDEKTATIEDSPDNGKMDVDIDENERRRLRKEKAVREREERVRIERGIVEANIGRSRNELNKEEGERDFRTLLTDAIREPQMTWESALPQLQTDPRFRNSPLPVDQMLHLFHTHIGHLRGKHIKSLHTLFESYAPSLATDFKSIPIASLLSSLPVTKLGYTANVLEHEFEKWQRERTFDSRKAFDDMLSENSFVEFWGRLGKIGGEGVDGGVKADDTGEDEGEGGGGKVDMKALAKNVDVREMEKVLKNDKRYIMFDHVPEQRERWIRAARHLYRFSRYVRVLKGVSTSLGRAMRILPSLFLSLSFITSYVAAQDGTDAQKETYDYQSDVARMRKIVINSLYSHKEVFLRELISNANDALEKLRLVSLTDKTVWDGSDPLNITIKAEKSEDGSEGTLIITDTGIGMSPEELKRNLGTLAKSGTSEFLARAESQDGTNTGNLIGAFGLGFYSSFLVADKVRVASLPPPSAENPHPIQHVFSSSAEEGSFDIYPDPRGNTLGRGTEITLHLKSEDIEYVETSAVIDLVNKHSSFSSSFPIYLFTQRFEEVPDEDAEAVVPPSEAEVPEEPKDGDEVIDEDEGIVEDVTEEAEPVEVPPPATKSVLVDEWVQLNAQAPLWTRDPKTVSDEEYRMFYKATFKDNEDPLAWHHFSGDSGSGVSFKAIIFLPNKLDDAYWQQPLASKSKDIRLMVKRVFITNDLGDDALPKWASWVKVVIDAEDLPLNVSRETLQSNLFLRQLKQIILKRIIQLFTRLSEEEGEKLEEMHKTYGSILKLGAVEDLKNRDKLTALTRFATNQRESVSLDQYLENKKQGQKQIFFLAEMGKETKDLAKSVFVEKLDARGYEVLLLNEPLDEILVQNIRNWKKISFQDVAKVGLKFGDEDLDAEEAKENQEALAEKFKPLLDYLKKEAEGVVRDVTLSDRLVTSPCAIVADSFGYTANVQRMMSASHKGNNGPNDVMHEFAMKAKLLEINPRSPLIEGLLRKVEALPEDEEEKDLEAEEELKEVTSILIDGALIRSGFEVPDTNDFFSRVDRVLRRSLGVSETAPTDTTVKPAPPVDPELPEPEDFLSNKPGIVLPDHMKDQVSIEMEEIDEFGNVVVNHDEL